MFTIVGVLETVYYIVLILNKILRGYGLWTIFGNNNIVHMTNNKALLFNN